MSYDNDDDRMIFMWVLMGLGLSCSFYVVAMLLKFGTMKSSFTFLLFFLELSLIGEQITAIPYIFTYNSSFCTVIAFFASYFGMMNIVLVGLLIAAHRLTLFNNTLRFRRKIVKYGPEISLIFPLITLIPFARDIYDHHRLPWCFAKPHEEIAWMMGVYYGWIGLLLFLSFINIFALTVRVCIIAPDLARRFFSSVGMCAFASIFSWIPRFLILVSGNTNMYGVVCPLYFQSVLVGIIFYFDQKSLESNERHYSTNAPVNFRASNSSAFSWEVGELIEELSIAGLIDLENYENSRGRPTYLDDEYVKKDAVSTSNVLHDDEKQQKVEEQEKQEDQA